MRLRAAPDDYADVVDTSHPVRLRVDVWRGAELLAGDVPVAGDGAELIDTGDQEVPERVRLRVPAFDPATSSTWRPREPLDPLNSYGQRLRLTYLVDRGPAGEVAPLVVPLGSFAITGWSADAELVEVEAAGLLEVVKRARLLAPTSPPVGATFASELRRLLEGMLPLDVDAGLVDRPVPRSFTWNEDRLGALYELVDAWPAELYVDELGVARVVPPVTAATPAELELVESGGTVVELADESGDRADNVVVARGEDSSSTDRPPVVGYAVDDDPTSPTYYRGPYGQVVSYFTSPLLTTAAAATTAAATVLARRQLRVRSVPLTSYPDARVRAGARVNLRRVDGSLELCRVLSHRLPLSAAGGASKLELGRL